MPVMCGMFGLAFDLGRTFIVRSELQTFVDASAMAAAQRMDGTQAGVTGANAIAVAGPLGTAKPNELNFETTQVTGAVATFSTSPAGPWDSLAVASQNATNSYRFIKVTASTTVPLYFLPVVGVPASQVLNVVAVGGQQAASSASSGGMVPFSPSAHNAADTTNFGLTVGSQYTLKWGNGNSTTCAGDSGFDPGNAPSAHGFIDLGQGKGNSSLRGVIVYGGYPNANSTPSSVSNGTVLDGVPGNKGSSIFTALAERSAQDPDQTSTTLAAYLATGTGNGRRIVTAPINDPSQSGGNGANWHVTVVGFGNFLIDPSSTISGSSGPICGTYIGPASLTGVSSGATDGTKIYSSLLYQ